MSGNPPAARHREIWAFWAACGLAAAGGVVPMVLAGLSGRISLVIIPYGVAAIGLGACAALQQRGRTVVAGLYFVAGLAIVYGLIAMLAVPLRLAVIGTCPPGGGACAPGLQAPMSEGESTGFGFAVGMGIAAILVGFFGLVVLFRRARKMSSAPAAPATPPVRRIPPVRTKPVVPEAPRSAQTDRAAGEHADIEPAAELPAHEQELELPAHVADEAAPTGESAPTTGGE